MSADSQERWVGAKSLNIHLPTLRYKPSKTEINQRKSIEYCAQSNRIEAGIVEQSLSRAAQNDGVLHAECGTPERRAIRKSQHHSNFHAYRAQAPRAKLKNRRAPHHCAPTARNYPRKSHASASSTRRANPRAAA
jgi:hypothetical protein